jgi:hypothetical protein
MELSTYDVKNPKACTGSPEVIVDEIMDYLRGFIDFNN